MGNHSEIQKNLKGDMEMIDYESKAITGNPFEGLSSDECLRMMIYFTVVREPVLTSEEVKARWDVEIPPEEQLPVFKVAEIAEEIRTEIKVRSRQTLKWKSLCAVSFFALLVALVALVLLWFSMRGHLSEWEIARTACNDARVQQDANNVINEKIKAALHMCAEGKISDCKTVAYIKDLLYPLPKEVERREDVCEKAEQLLRRVSQAMDSGDAHLQFATGTEIEKFLTKYVKNSGGKVGGVIGTEMRLDLENSMLKCYMKSAEKISSAEFRLAMVYGVSLLCESRSYNGYIVSENTEVAKANLLSARKYLNYEALVWEFDILTQDSEDEKNRYSYGLNFNSNHKILNVPFWEECRAIGKAIVSHQRATGDDIYKVAKWFEKYPVEEVKGQAASYFKLAAQKGNVEAKKWLVARGLDY